MARKPKQPKATPASKKNITLSENAGQGIKQDAGRMAKGVGAKGRGASSVKSAAKRAGRRMLQRAGVVGLAAGAGHDIGKAINKATGLSGKISSVASDISRNTKTVKKKKGK